RVGPSTPSRQRRPLRASVDPPEAGHPPRSHSSRRARGEGAQRGLVQALLLPVLNALMGCGRSLYLAVHDGLLPRLTQSTNRHGAPDYAMAFNLACSVMGVFVASRLENYVSSNMGYLLSVCLALFGYFVHLQQHPGVPRPVRMP